MPGAPGGWAEKPQKRLAIFGLRWGYFSNSKKSCTLCHPAPFAVVAWAPQILPAKIMIFLFMAKKNHLSISFLQFYLPLRCRLPGGKFGIFPLRFQQATHSHWFSIGYDPQNMPSHQQNPGQWQAKPAIEHHSTARGQKVEKRKQKEWQEDEGCCMQNSAVKLRGACRAS